MYNIVVLCLFATSLANAAPLDEDYIKTVKDEKYINPDRSYTYSYETENGIKATETGTLKQLPVEQTDGETTDDGPVIVVQGSYSYVDPEGKTVLVEYTADENGYNAKTTRT